MNCFTASLSRTSLLWGSSGSLNNANRENYSLKRDLAWSDRSFFSGFIKDTRLELKTLFLIIESCSFLLNLSSLRVFPFSFSLVYIFGAIFNWIWDLQAVKVRAPEYSIVASDPSCSIYFRVGNQFLDKIEIPKDFAFFWWLHSLSDSFGDGWVWQIRFFYFLKDIFDGLISALYSLLL